MKIRYRTFIALALLATGMQAFAAERGKDYSKLYDQCIKKAGTINNGVVDACSSQVSDQAKVEMNALYKVTYQRLREQSPSAAVALEQAQKAWLVYRDTHCQLAGEYVGSPMHAYCPMQLNIERVDQLRELSGQ